MNEKKVILNVMAEAGKYTDDFNLHQQISHVIRKTLNHFGIAEKLFPQFELIHGDTPLNNSATIEELGLNDTSLLYLRNKGPIVDGGR